MQLKPCKKCPIGTPPPYKLIAGLCPVHYNQEWVSRSREKGETNFGRVIFRSHKKSKFTHEDHQSLSDWFDFQIEHNENICENCGAVVPNFDEAVRRSTHAHILPKAVFKSVATNLDNHLVLGGMFSSCGCHGRYDSSWSTASEMPVFELAKQRFLKFKHLILPAEIRHLPSQFLNLF